MLPWAILSFLIAICQCEFGGEFEDAKELVSSFKSVVDIPMSQDFKKAHRFLGFAATFMQRTVPFAELFATALKIGLEEDQLENLLKVTNGIDAKVTKIARQQQYLLSSTLYRDLILEYEEKVQERLDSFLRQIRVMSNKKMNVPEALIDVFTHDCNSINSPATIAQFLFKLVLRCDKPALQSTPITQIFNLLNDFKYMRYTLNNDEEHEFFHRISVLYFSLVARPATASFFEKFAEERQDVVFQNKIILLDELIEELGIDEDHTPQNLCIPKVAFSTHGYKREAVQHFADLLMEHMTSLKYVTLMCANITFWNDPEGADIFTAEVYQNLQPVEKFISHWFDEILNNTWPSTENLLIRNVMQDFAKGATIPETNQSYTKMLELVQEKMKLVGHPSYDRQYIATKYREVTELSNDFWFACKPNACSNTSAMNAQCLSMRSRTDNNKNLESLQELIEFRNASWPIFFKAMDSQLYDYKFVSRVIQLLANTFGLNLNNFAKHSSYTILRKQIYWANCSTTFALKANEDLDNSYLQLLHYHEDGTTFTDCEDWLVILGF